MADFDNGFDLIDREEVRILQYLSKCVSPVECVPHTSQHEMDVLFLKGFISSRSWHGNVTYHLSSQGRDAVNHLGVG